MARSALNNRWIFMFLTVALKIKIEQSLLKINRPRIVPFLKEIEPTLEAGKSSIRKSSRFIIDNHKTWNMSEVDDRWAFNDFIYSGLERIWDQVNRNLLPIGGSLRLRDTLEWKKIDIYLNSYHFITRMNWRSLNYFRLQIDASLWEFFLKINLVNHLKIRDLLVLTQNKKNNL